MLFVTLQTAFLTSALILKTTLANVLPTYFPKCYLNDPKLNDCILNGLNTMKPYIGYGIEEIGLPSLKPLYVQKLEIRQEGPLANYSLILNNYTVWGLDNYEIIEFQYDPNSLTFHGGFKYDKVIMSSLPADISGQILLAPVKGIGLGHSAIGPISGIFEVNGVLKNVNGIDFYNTTNVNVHLSIVDGSYFMSNLFDDLDLAFFLPRCYLDDPELNECVLRAFNEIRPHVSNGIEEIGLPPLNPLFIPKLTIRQDSPMANYTTTWTKFTLGGLDNYDIKEFLYDPRINTFHFRIEFSPLQLAGIYELSGHVVHIHLEGKGIGRAAI
ncbi:hypothetical protein ILUMI_20240, partial [Ignelater luminosus]